MNIKHILITSDLSQEALRAFEPVLELAENLKARVTLLHVVYDLQVAPHGAALAPPVSSPSTAGEVEHAMQSLKELSTKLDTKVEVQPVVIASAEIAKAVVAYAEENDVDLIALSTHGRTGWRHMVLGSVAESILQLSPIPVLSFQRTK